MKRHITRRLGIAIVFGAALPIGQAAEVTEPPTLVRKIAMSPELTAEIRRDSAGGYTVSSRAVTVTEGNTRTKDNATGDFCFGCLEANEVEFKRILDTVKSAPRRPRQAMARVDDFYLSRSGVLIHEECFEKFDFDVEQAVTDMVVKGLTCKLDLMARSERAFGIKGVVYESHIPRLVNLLTNHHRLEEGVLFEFNGALGLMAKPCEQYRQVFPMSLTSHMHLSDDCRYVPTVETGRPKVICQLDQFASAGAKYLGQDSPDRAHGYATGPHAPQPAFVNWKGATKVYGYPVISILESGRNSDMGLFQATIWHELMHNVGYAHLEDYGDEDYPWFCEFGCFGDEYPAGVLDGGSINWIKESMRMCATRSQPYPSMLNDVLRTVRNNMEASESP